MKVILIDDSLIATLNLLDFLSKMNEQEGGLKVPYDTFHINDLSEYLDIRLDYVAWLTDSSVIKENFKKYMKSCVILLLFVSESILSV